MTAPRDQPFRKQWPQRNTAVGAQFSDAGHRREPLPESAAWNIVNYLLAGLLMFGVPGFLLDRWLGTTWLVGVGIVLGMAVAMVTVWLRYGTDASSSASVDRVPVGDPQPSTAADRPTSTAQAPAADRPQEEQP